MKLKNATINPTLTIGNCEDWSNESLDVAMARNTSKGRTLFEKLWQDFPQIKEEIIFLKWSVQPDDVYAVRDVVSGGFVVQIDPALDLIIVWNEESGCEYGAWTPADSPVNSALKHIDGIIRANE